VSGGYLLIGVGGRKYLAQHLAVALMTGRAPVGVVDHADRNPLNNRWKNLREVTRADNAINSGVPANNTSGFRGVSWHRASGRWRAHITLSGRQVSLGYHAHISDAVTARKLAEAAAFPAVT